MSFKEKLYTIMMVFWALALVTCVFYGNINIVKLVITIPLIIAGIIFSIELIMAD